MSETPFRLDWNRLLSDKRPSIDDGGTAKKRSRSRSGRSEFERDIDRVVFSPAFRRLAKKTQVHPFAEIDHVHNRLTHSLEVASVGRSLANIAGELIQNKGEMPQGRTVADLKAIVQTACFAHDIGNPPFGHAGESAIREWSKEHAANLFGTEMANQYHGLARDWLFFEGNAQSFRLVSRPDNRDQAYYKLTYASLGSMIKYPWLSQDEKTAKEEKCNAFSSEADLFNDVTETLGLQNSETSSIARHPFSFLSEVADDICYRITDFEDAVQMKILSEREVRRIFQIILGGHEKGPLSCLRAKTIGHLTKVAGQVFADNYEKIMRGKRDASHDLKSSFPQNELRGLKIIKSTYDSIFNDRRKIATEFGAFNVLGKILLAYTRTVKTISIVRDYDKLSFMQKRCVDLAWGKAFVKTHKREKYEWWMGTVMDFVAGMTDNYATQVACEIEGMRY